VFSNETSERPKNALSDDELSNFGTIIANPPVVKTFRENYDTEMSTHQ